MLLLVLLMLQISPCDVWGAVYETEHKRDADVIVYEEDSESFADLIVYDQDYSLYADRSGHWHFVEEPRAARFKVYFTQNRDEADFTVFFTRYESFAGCE